nr:hypothetical protein [Tanacetum cinerariifolium]
SLSFSDFFTGISVSDLFIFNIVEDRYVIFVILFFLSSEGEVLNDFPIFISALIADFAAGSAVNITLKMNGGMIIENLSLKPTVDAMMREFLDKSLKRVYASDRDSL